MKKTKTNRVAAIVAAVAIGNVNFRIGQANGSGVGKYLYFIPSDYITRWPLISNNLVDAATAARYIGYDGDFELADGAYWIRIYNTQGEGSMTAEPTGERDSRMFMNKLSFRYPKLTKNAAVLSNAVVNGDGIFIGWHDGAYRVVGHKHYRCDVTLNVTSGDAAGSSKGITFEAECPDYKALPVYRGNLILEDGILNCNTDTFINYEDMNTNKTQDYSGQIKDNAVRFEALGKEGRIHIEGSGPIVMEVSVDGVNYATVDHNIAFSSGVAVAPFQFYIGDKVRISATTLTKVIVNYNDLKTN